MTTLSLLLNTIIYLLAKVNTHDDLTQTTKSKGRDALTPQPFSQFSPITEQIDHEKL